MATPWNGRGFLCPRVSADVSLDASSNGWLKNLPGLGCFNHVTGQYIATGVPLAFQNWDIADLEMLCFIVAARAWGDGWHAHQINILTDSEPTRFLVEAGKSRLSRRLAMARKLVALQFSGGFRIHSARVSTTKNVCADSLSRFGAESQRERFATYCNKYGVLPVRTEVDPDWFVFESDW